jgi:hypothetical protein
MQPCAVVQANAEFGIFFRGDDLPLSLTQWVRSTGEVDTSILSLSPKAPDSSNPNQPTKSVKNFFTTGCFKRITTLLEILRT